MQMDTTCRTADILFKETLHDEYAWWLWGPFMNTHFWLVFKLFCIWHLALVITSGANQYLKIKPHKHTHVLLSYRQNDSRQWHVIHAPNGDPSLKTQAKTLMNPNNTAPLIVMRLL